MKQRQVFSKEFKLEAVRLLESSDRPAAEIARQLGIRRNQLYKWQQELRRRGNGAFAGPGRPATQDDELAQLRRELECVKEERDILKKAVAFFARESK
jgi:transposase